MNAEEQLSILTEVQGAAGRLKLCEVKLLDGELDRAREHANAAIARLVGLRARLDHAIRMEALAAAARAQGGVAYSAAELADYERRLVASRVVSESSACATFAAVEQPRGKQRHPALADPVRESCPRQRPAQRDRESVLAEDGFPVPDHDEHEAANGDVPAVPSAPRPLPPPAEHPLMPGFRANLTLHQGRLTPIRT